MENRVMKASDRNRLVECYKESADQFCLLAEYVVEAQGDIIKELNKLKKLKGSTSKTSSQGSGESGLEAYEHVRQMK
jgi:hypothetical protein